DITSARCIKTKEKKPVNTKSKLKQEQCLNTPKQCYNKQPPVNEKPSSIKLPVLFPDSRKVAFQVNITLPGGAFFAVMDNSSPTF
ncbi:MAG: hypothetical protein M3Q05_01935, partial [Bacteroidota bacterium]|nr:hypothetical protein [Bacteroidota bacterium]